MTTIAENKFRLDSIDETHNAIETMFAICYSTECNPEKSAMCYMYTLGM